MLTTTIRYAGLLRRKPGVITLPVRVPSARMDDPMAVLDSRFRVRGVQNLRVVDASVFPRIPGLFIVTNVYMISEKASDVITEDNNNRGEER